VQALDAIANDIIRQTWIRSKTVTTNSLLWIRPTGAKTKWWTLGTLFFTARRIRSGICGRTSGSIFEESKRPEHWHCHGTWGERRMGG